MTFKASLQKCLITNSTLNEVKSKNNEELLGLERKCVNKLVKTLTIKVEELINKNNYLYTKVAVEDVHNKEAIINLKRKHKDKTKFLQEKIESLNYQNIVVHYFKQQYSCVINLS